MQYKITKLTLTLKELSFFLFFRGGGGGGGEHDHTSLKNFIGKTLRDIVTGSILLIIIMQFFIQMAYNMQGGFQQGTVKI